MKFSPAYLLAFAPIVAAHFRLQYPTSRGFNADTMAKFSLRGLGPILQQDSGLSFVGLLPCRLKDGPR